GQVEGALEVDVPELVGARPFIARTGDPGQARPVGSASGQEPIDLPVADRDTSPAELGRDPPAVPVAEHPDDEDRLLELRREVAPTPGAWPIEEACEAVAVEAGPPAEECRPTAPADRARLADRRSLGPRPDRLGLGPDRCCRRRMRPARHRAPALGGDEQEPGPFLVVVPPG